MASASVLERLIVQLVGDGTSFQRMMQNATKTTFAAGRAMTSAVQTMANNVERGLNRVAGRAMQMGRILTMAVTLPVAAAGAASVKLGADMETAAVGFEVLLGSASKAETMLGQIRKMAVATPFDNVQLRDAAKILLNYGVAGENIMPMLRVLGDVSMGDAEKLHRLAVAYGQASAAGRLMGHDLLQMINAGFNPLQEISKRTGETLGQLRDRMHAGNIGVAEMTTAFVDAVSEGGRFHNMMDRMSKTLTGRWSTLVDVTKVLLTTLGTDLMPILKQLVEYGIQLVEWTNRLPAGLRITIAAMAGIAAAAGPFLLALGYLSTAIAGVVAAVGMVAGGLTTWVPALAALTAGVVALGAALAGAVYWLVGPKSLTTAWDSATAAAGRFVNGTVGFIANLQHNLGVLYTWMRDNWSYVLEDMVRLAVTFAVNTGSNLLVLVDTARRLFALWHGWMTQMFNRLFTMDFVNAVVRGIAEAKMRFAKFTLWVAMAMHDAMRGRVVDMTSIGRQMGEDLVRGLTTKNIGEETRRVLQEQMGKLRFMEGFESSIPKGPEFKFDLPKAAEELDAPIKAIDELRGLTDTPVELKFKISGLDAVAYGSAKMAADFERFNKEVELMGPHAFARRGPTRVHESPAIGGGGTLTASDRSGFFAGGDDRSKEIVAVLEEIAGNTAPSKKGGKTIVFQPANLRGRT